MKPRIIIPAAGESRRFRKKGILTPKPLIKFSWGEFPKKTMLQHATYGLENEVIHVGVLNSMEKKFKDELDSSNFIICPISESLGQADTVYQVANRLSCGDCHLLILNSDSMFLYPLRVFLEQAIGFDAATIVFDGQYNPSYSYIDKYPIFNKCAEKEPISPWAIAGAFYFRSRDQFLRAYEKHHAHCTGEEYLSEVYNHYDGAKLAVYVPREQWIVWGTAEELLSDENVNEIEF